MKKRILVVDDDSINLARTQIILGKEYDVLTAESGIDALMTSASVCWLVLHQFDTS